MQESKLDGSGESSQKKTSKPEEVLKCLMGAYRQKVIQGERYIDSKKMIRARCRYCDKCKRRGDCDMNLLPAFEALIRIDEFVSVYMRGIAKLAADGRSPDPHWATELASSTKFLDICDECVKAATEEEKRLRKCIPDAINEVKALAATNNKDKDSPCRAPRCTPCCNQLLEDIYRWFRPEVNAQLRTSWPSLSGQVSSGSIMCYWTFKFFERLEGFETTFRIQGKEQVAFPPEQLVGNFLNFMTAQKQFTFKECFRRLLRNAVDSLHTSGVEYEIAADTPTPLQLLVEDEQNTEVQLAMGKALLQLSAEELKIIFMDQEGETNEEIAEAIGVSLGSVNGKLTRARKKLRSILFRDYPSLANQMK